MAAVQASKFDCLEVREAGRALKVQSDNPHLVSIGSGRLSTNVTWHPLPEGKVVIGSSSSADIILQGTGVEPRHCIIENVSNVVTMYPLADMTTIDGVAVTIPSRLSQGNMICIGRSNYFRFNHPAEADLMKKFLPNTRISMAAPLNFFGNGEPSCERKPPPAPHRRSRDSWGDSDDASVSNKVIKFEYLAECQNQNKISPKVFPPGSTTVNSPASAVLGHSRIPNGLVERSKTSSNGTLDYIEAPVPQIISSYPQKATISYSQSQNQLVQNGYGNPLFAGYTCGDACKSQRVVAVSSPVFNRNMSPFSTKNSPTYSLRSITPSPCNSHTFSPDADVMSRSFDSSLSPSFAEDFNARKDELEMKMLQAQEERKREQEAQLLERQRLEEILTICAEYERQVQSERHTKLPTTPTMQQNRIKTNGSLPRDKRSNGLSSPIANSNSEDELNQIFTFETKSLPRSKVPGNERPRMKMELVSRSPYENLSKSKEEENPEKGKTVDLAAVVSKRVYVENTLIIKPLEGEAPVGQSPRTRIRTTVKDQSPKDQTDIANQLAIMCDYDTVDPIKSRNSSPNVQKRKFLTPSQQLCQFSGLSELLFTDDKSKMNGESDLNDLMKRLELEFSNSLPDFGNPEKEMKKMDANDELPESERHINEEKNDSTESAKDEIEEKKPENFMRQKKKDDEKRRLKIEKTTWMSIITRLKSEIHNIEQQEEEILREMRMEAALVNAEYASQKEKHKAEEEKLSILKERQKQLDSEIDQCKARDSELLRNCNERIEELKKGIEKAEASLGKHKLLSEDYKNLVEKLEAEKKSFEDIEFKQLEEEANWLATKDDLQREIFDASSKLETKKTRLAELENQIEEMEKLSQIESGNLEARKIKLMQQLEQARTKLKELDVRLSLDKECMENSRDLDESMIRMTPEICRMYLRKCKGRPKSKQSQEDLVRISKVTTDAPIDIGKTGSLGRKTVESLKEIERIRQMNLAKQGSQVIEEERKRVEQLKRRVQDEVRAQWEQSRQRECNSLNSVGSEESSLTCSDQPTESASSDDVDKALTSTMVPVLQEINDRGTLEDKLRAKDSDGEEFRNSRPISDYSCSDFEQQIVKKRDVKPARMLQQRPLTRYLPIRSETLNLRQHIESAGHQVDLCPHVIIDATSCRGFLHKLGGKFHNWNKRWFVFDRTRRTLTYYSDKTEKKHRGGTYFQAIEEVYVDHLNSVKSPQPHLTFVIKTHERTFYLMAPGAEAMRIWVDVIFTGAEGYQEFEHGS